MGRGIFMRAKYYILTAVTAFSALYANNDYRDDFDDDDDDELAEITSEAPSSIDRAPSVQVVQEENQEARHYQNRIQIGGNYTYAWITPHGNPTTHGSMGGTQFLYEFCPRNTLYAGLMFNWRIGKTTHGDIPSRSLQDFNLQNRLGYTVWCDTYKMGGSLFSGLGARYMPETVKSDLRSVDFDYTTFYVPVGILFEKEFTSMFSCGLNFIWLPPIFPTVHIQPLTGAWWSLHYRLDNFFVEVPFKITACSNRFFFIMSPFFEIWHDGHSTAHTTLGFDGPKGLMLGLPANRYLFTGINVNFGIAF
jgi:hypothetical protein